MLEQKTAEHEPSSVEQRRCFETAEIPPAGLVLKPAPGFHTRWVSRWVLPRRHLQNTCAAHSHITGDTGEMVAGMGRGKTVKPQVVCGPEPPRHLKAPGA